jgi:outer membrane protein insertion porin family
MRVVHIIYAKTSMIKWIHNIILCGILILGYTGIAYGASDLEIQYIAIQGNSLIPESTILSQIESRVGALYKPEIVTKDIQKIYDIGFFSAVDVHAETMEGKIHLTYIVKERPLISSIQFTGNDKINDDKIEEVLSLPPSDLSDPFKTKFYPLKIQEDLQNIKQLYREEGYHNAQITSQLLPDPADPEGKVTLEYIIEERKKVTVKGITFEGNTAFSEEQLKNNMATKKKGFLSFITGTGKYEETNFETDLERIKFFYADKGYIDAKVVDYSLNFQEDTSDLFITIAIDEGEIYTIKSTTVEGNSVYATEDIDNVLNVSPGDPFSRSAIRQDILAISDLYAKQGYLTPIAEKTEGKLLIDPRIDIDREAKQVSLVYNIREGVPHFLNRVTITGNQNTRDKVIRRELLLQEGEIFDSKRMSQSQQRIFNLGLFEDVVFNMEDGPESDTVDLEIQVSERSTGSFNFGGGWSSFDRFILSAGISHANVFGLAHQINFSVSLSSRTQTFNLNYTMPRFLDSQYLLGIDAYKLRREYSSYDDDSVGGGFRFGRRLTLNTFGTLKYEYRQTDITNVDENASNIIKESEGLSKTSSASAQLRYSTINNVLLPTKGTLTKFSAELAGGILQGENDFYKFMLNNNTYFSLYKDWALRLKGEIDYAEPYGNSDVVPIFERFFAGGANTIRGYEERSVGPKDENNDPVGGTKRILFTAETIIPVRKELRLVAFIDMGDVYTSFEDVDLSTFRKGAGVGVRFLSPLGLLRLDWGYALDREEGDAPSQWHFGFGGLF